MPTTNDPNLNLSLEGPGNKIEDKLLNEHKDQVKFSGNVNKLIKRLRHLTGKAIEDFKMIEEGDRIMVCMSGGKDSYVLLDLLLSLQRSAPVSFSLIAVHLEGGFPLYPHNLVENYLKNTGVEYHIIKEDIYTLLKQTMGDKPLCSMCSRLRRGIIYRVAKELNIDKIALGHHADDILETFFLNLFYGGKLKAMPPKLITDDSANIVIRPMAYCRESDISRLARAKQYPIIPKELCALVANKERSKVKDMIKMWDKQQHGRSQIMFKALMDINLSHLLDTSLYDFTFNRADIIRKNDEQKED